MPIKDTKLLILFFHIILYYYLYVLYSKCTEYGNVLKENSHLCYDILCLYKIMNKTNILFLIDGSSLLSSSFFGTLPNSYRFAKTDEERDAALPELIQTSTGVYINGISTMFRQIENIIKKVNPSHLAVAWDLTRDTFRRGLYPLYKSNRKDGRPELLSQFAIAQEMLKEMNIPSFAYMEYEADDIIGTLSRRFEDVIKVVILTKDQDALQLITSDVSVWLCKRHEL